MRFLDTIAQKWNGLWDKARPAVYKTGAFCKKAGDGLTRVWRYVVKLRKVFMAVPVGVGAVYLAMNNMSQLPETVGIDLQSDGTFSMLIAREMAVLGPIAITALCLLLMFCSKRTLTPWLVSVFSLAIPLLILITNVFPS